MLQVAILCEFLYKTDLMTAYFHRVFHSSCGYGISPNLLGNPRAEQRLTEVSAASKPRPCQRDFHSRAPAATARPQRDEFCHPRRCPSGERVVRFTQWFSGTGGAVDHDVTTATFRSAHAATG